MNVYTNFKRIDVKEKMNSIIVKLLPFREFFHIYLLTFLNYLNYFCPQGYF